MYMLAYIGHLCNNLQRLVAHVLGVRCGKSYAHLWSLKRYSAQKVRKTIPHS